MRKALRLALREYRAAVRTKGFIIGLLVMPVLMGGSGLAMMLLKDQVDTADQRLAVMDHSGIVAPAIVEAAEERNAHEVYDESGEKVKPAYVIEVLEPAGADDASWRLALSDRVRRGDLRAFVEIGEGVGDSGADRGLGRIQYYAKNAAIDDMRRWLGWPINNRLRAARLERAGIDAQAVPGLFDWRAVEGMGLVTVDEKTGEVQEARQSSEGEAIGIPVILTMLMFMMILMGAMPLLQSVMEEKVQRIAEVLLGSLRPFQFMMGKVLGGVAVSLTSASVYVIGGILIARRLGVAEYVPYEVLPWFFGYMFLAIIMIGAMLASLGSACNDAKEAQSMTLPAMIPVMIPMFVMMPVIREPQSAFATYLSFFPPSTPMLMIMRLCTPGGIPSWQPWVGLLTVLLFTVLSVWAGGRIFRIGILMQGKAPQLGEIMRWIVRG